MPTQKEGSSFIGEIVAKDSWLRKQYPQLARKYAEFSANTDLTFQQILAFATVLQVDVARAFPQEGIAYRDIDPDKALDLRKFIEQNGGGIIVMRHGKQVLENEPVELEGAAKKVISMYPDHNINDPAEGQSLVESSAFALVVAQISREFKIPVSVLTSSNLRASEVAAPTAFVNHFRIKPDLRLNCANYPEGTTVEQIDTVLGKDAQGSMYWQKAPVDAVFGEGYYQATVMNMSDMIKENTGPKITLVVTHTPQMNAVDVICGENPSRVPELGIRVLGSRGRNIQLPHCIFHSAA